jgi:hypothetical protein
MGPTDRFSSKVDSLEDAPEPARTVLADHLAPGDSIRFMLYGPMSKNVSYVSPATLLAVTRKGWAIVTESGNRTVVHQSSFENTLLLELTQILLFGRLRVDYAADGRTGSVAMEYNTVMGELYRQALQLLVDGIEGDLPDLPVNQEHVTSLLAPLSMKFRDGVLRSLPHGQKLMGLVHWPACLGQRRGWLQRELVPAGVLLLTDRELVLVSEEETWSWRWSTQRETYGTVATFCPLSRLVTYQVSGCGEAHTLDLEIRTTHGGEKLKIGFPRDRDGAVLELMQQTVQHQFSDPGIAEDLHQVRATHE